MEGPIDQYHEWFQLATSMWLYLAKLKATKRIKKAVELDEVSSPLHSFQYCDIGHLVMQKLHRTAHDAFETQDRHYFAYDVSVVVNLYECQAVMSGFIL